MDLDTLSGPDLAALLDELERHRSADVETRLEQARVLEARAREQGATAAAVRARLVAADMLHRVGEVGEAAALAVEVNSWAAANGPRGLLARSHLVLSSILEGTGDLASGLDHALRAIALLPDGAGRRVRGVHLLRLADALAVNGSPDESRRRYREAEAIFVDVGEVDLLRTVFNNEAMLELEVGNVAGALAAVDELSAVGGGELLDAALADTVARVRLAAGDLEAAEEILDVGFRLLGEQGDVQAVTPAELLLTDAEVLLAAGRHGEAAAQLERCFAVCEERGLRGTRVHALRVRAELLAAQGRFEEAYHAHGSFHVETVELRSRQHEAAARTRQALFETAEARRAAQRFWEQARTDPLTELYNRRFVDEELPRYLKETSRRGGCLVAGLLDVDHFKQVNDRFSHGVGDDVLRLLAARLAALGERTDGAADEEAEGCCASFAARLGGEEFLVVQVVDDEDLAFGLLDGLRRELAAHRWADLAPGLAVTVSIGATRALPADTQATLLTRADGHLYGAKRAGRNRTVGDRS